MKQTECFETTVYFAAVEILNDGDFGSNILCISQTDDLELYTASTEEQLILSTVLGSFDEGPT